MFHDWVVVLHHPLLREVRPRAVQKHQPGKRRDPVAKPISSLCADRLSIFSVTIGFFRRSVFIFRTVILSVSLIRWTISVSLLKGNTRGVIFYSLVWLSEGPGSDSSWFNTGSDQAASGSGPQAVGAIVPCKSLSTHLGGLPGLESLFLYQ